MRLSPAQKNALLRAYEHSEYRIMADPRTSRVLCHLGLAYDIGSQSSGDSVFGYASVPYISEEGRWYVEQHLLAGCACNESPCEHTPPPAYLDVAIRIVLDQGYALVRGGDAGIYPGIYVADTSADGYYLTPVCGFCLEPWGDHTEPERISCERDLASAIGGPT